jgi:hypothetical protein
VAEDSFLVGKADHSLIFKYDEVKIWWRFIYTRARGAVL